ncbi:polysaccharide deacetylase [Sphingomonas sp. Leaf33]|uniref:polysaccharide deacetylase family protein n=1 Tax=Sphingomonas sp. Leaf33 TaxID=1736215 RepID=UPI0006FC2FA6|nr:polysaccharide deacetylase family protein [Sphingomonas sp. Leaf33]KQN19393.1 polysaccharide deacetylase [Sphingomonas sp. Leaf33]
MTAVFLTIDTELMWRHHAAGLPTAEIVRRSLEPAGVGVAYQLAMLQRHGLKATFFVDPMPALVYGRDHVARVVDAILVAGQEVQLHLHPNWTGADAADRSAHARFELIEYSATEQRALLEQARDLLVAAGAPVPVAFRAGSYAANDDTLAALTSLGFSYDSSHNGAHHPWPSAIGLPVRQIAPVVRGGLIEVPVTVIEDRAGGLRHFQLCALSVGEMRAALDHAAARDHAAVTIVSHGFELAARAGTHANAVHVRRFDALCALLEARRDVLPTAHFADRPPLRLTAQDVPLGPSAWRTRWRQAEQLWSNLIAERAA